MTAEDRPEGQDPQDRLSTLQEDIEIYVKYGGATRLDSERLEDGSRIDFKTICGKIADLRAEYARIEITQQSQRSGQYD